MHAVCNMSANNVLDCRYLERQIGNANTVRDILRFAHQRGYRIHRMHAFVEGRNGTQSKFVTQMRK